MTYPFFQTIIHADVPLLDYYSECKEEKKRLFSFAEAFIELLHLLKEHRGQVYLRLALPPAFYVLIHQPEFKSQMDGFLQEKEKGQCRLWEECNGDLNSVLNMFIQEGKLEIIGFPVTGVILPFLTTSQAVEIQIQTGRMMIYELFGFKPDGFWFPEGAYTPGLDLIVKDAGYQYSYMDEATVLSADPTPLMTGLPVQSPHGLNFFPIHEKFSQLYAQDDLEKSIFASELISEIKALAYSETETTISVAVDLRHFIENSHALKEISYLADEGFLFINLENYVFSHSFELVHLCSSFLSEEGIEENRLMVNRKHMSEHMWMEQELQRLAKIPKEGEETRVYMQMVREWIMFSTSLFSTSLSANQRLFQHQVEGYLDHFRKLYSYLSGEVSSEIVTNREEELVVLSSIQLSTGETEIEKTVETCDQRKIVVLTWEFPPHIVGGLARHVHGLTKSLSKKGYEIHVITAGQDQLPAEERMDGVFVHRVKPLNENEKDFLMWIGGLNIALAEKVESLAREHQFDCIHAHDWLVGAAATVLKGRLAIPLVTTIHATEFGRNNGIHTEMQRFIHDKEKILVEQSDQIIVCSDYMKEEIQQLFNPSIEKLMIIPNGIESELPENFLQKDLLAGIPIDPNRKMIFSIGRMVKEKGFDTIIEAAAILREQRSDVYFIIAGKGPMLEEYRRKVVECKLSNSVFFIGFIDDDKRNALLKLCEIAVFPSRYEPFGIVALESMKVSKPTIVSNIGGLKGIVQHLKTGLLMVPGSTESLIEQMMRLLNDHNLAKEIAENGKRVVDRLFSWNRVAEETKRVFEETKLNDKL